MHKVTSILISILILISMFGLVGASADSIQTLTGTHDSGDIYSIRTEWDADYYKVTEIVAVPSIDVRVNFTQVAPFISVTHRSFYNGGSGHIMSVRIWNYSGSFWNTVMTFTDNHVFHEETILISDSSDYQDSNGLVQVAYNHTTTGNINHYILLDYLALNVAEAEDPDGLEIIFDFDNLLFGDLAIFGILVFIILGLIAIKLNRYSGVFVGIISLLYEVMLYDGLDIYGNNIWYMIIILIYGIFAFLSVFIKD